jgi:hypothetical protein
LDVAALPAELARLEEGLRAAGRDAARLAAGRCERARQAVEALL